jgi:folate-binding protein YgfZ
VESSSLRALHRDLGARFGQLAGVEVPRNYGDAAAEYVAAQSAAALVDRSDRTTFLLTGRAPVKMIQGLVSNDVAGAAEGQGVYATMLTPKGKLVADLRAFRLGEQVLLDVPAAAASAVRDHLRKFVPPLYARVEDPGLGMMSVYGPAAHEILARALPLVPAEQSEEDRFVKLSLETGPLVVILSRYSGSTGYDVLSPIDGIPALWEMLQAGGARPCGHAALEVLRIEAGQPRWGAELDENVIPLEAGLRERAISETKGCYTGQEVIIRILHRGHVNWHLRGLLFGDVSVPAAGTELMRANDAKVVGRVTSACFSPAHGQAIGLGYVRREIEALAELRLGRSEGPPARVVTLPFGSARDAPQVTGGV